MTPEVSIGVPVYNGAHFLTTSLESLLGQTFTDFELIVSDNASSDSTEEICRALAKQDRRIRYIRQDANLGAVCNWNFVAQMATGRFFKWSSANDHCEPTMLEKCVLQLRRDQSLVLAYPKTRLIDDAGLPIQDYERDPEIIDPRPSQRFIHAVICLELNNAQSGLIRTAVLRKTRGERGYPAGDMVLMAELALHGGFKLIPEYLFFRRLDKASTSRFLTRDQLAHFLRPQGGGMNFPTWRRFGDYFWTLARTPIGLRERTRASAAVVRWMVWARADLMTELRDSVLQRT